MRDLAVRDTHLRELMDDADCDLVALRATYAQFRVVNRAVAGWRGLYRRRLHPLLRPDRVTTLLDIGCGGGDVPRALANWAARDGLPLAVTAIDPDPRAYEFATTHPATEGLTFRRCTSADLVEEGRTYDLVLSNHVLHHLDESGLARLLKDSERLARQLVLHNDLARSRLAYAVFGGLSRLAGPRSLLRIDGLRSIRRAYRVDELRAMVPAGWRVASLFPCRVLVSWPVPRG